MPNGTKWLNYKISLQGKKYYNQNTGSYGDRSEATRYGTESAALEASPIGDAEQA